MIKKILNLSGAQELSRTEQKAIVGAGPFRRCCEYDFINGVRVCTLWVSGNQQCP